MERVGQRVTQHVGDGAMAGDVGGVVAREEIGLPGWEAIAAAADCGRTSTSSIAGLPAPPPIDGGTSLVEGGAITMASPLLSLSLRRCPPSAWRRFHAYHYKTPVLSTVATTFLLEATIQGAHAHLGACRERAAYTIDAIDAGVRLPAGFIATIPHSGKRSAWASAPAQRAHLTVVLPEWQGFGIGSRLSDAAAEWHRRRGSDYFGQTVHPRFGGYRDASPLWEGTEANHGTPELLWLPRRLTGAGQRAVAVKRQQPKMVFAHRYIGAAGDEAARHLDGRVHFETKSTPPHS